jgi:hypothetical protein
LLRFPNGQDKVTNEAGPLIERIIRTASADKRIPVLVLLGTSLSRALVEVFEGIDTQVLRQVVVLAGHAKPARWPGSLRCIHISDDELVNIDGCLCCAFRSELTAALSQLFFSALRRQQGKVGMVIVVTQANAADVLANTLKHAPFLGQRYRLVASLPSVVA